MAAPPDTIALDEVLRVSDDRVADHLRRHPDFLLRHPELIQTLTPPSRLDGDGVADMQTFMIERLRGEIERLKEHRDALVALSRGARSCQAQVHTAVVAMLGAPTLEHLIEVVTVDFLRLLHLDVVTLCVENTADRRPCRRAGIFCLEPATVDEVFGDGGDLLLAPETRGDPLIFGAGAGLVRSSALLRLDLGGRAPPCMLALGSRREGTFRPGAGGGELFGFLARSLEHCLRAWLDLPA